MAPTSLNVLRNQWILTIPEHVNNGNFSEWRAELKQRLLIERGYHSDLSGKRLYQCHLHEGIVTRATVPRGIWWHFQIYHPFNSFLLLPDEHIPHPPSRAWCIERAYELYGKELVRDWYYNLPWKSIPFQLP